MIYATCSEDVLSGIWIKRLVMTALVRSKDFSAYIHNTYDLIGSTDFWKFETTITILLSRRRYTRARKTAVFGRGSSSTRVLIKAAMRRKAPDSSTAEASGMRGDKI